MSGDGGVISPSGRSRKLDLDKHGYPRFSVKFNSSPTGLPVHRLAAYQKFGEAMFEDGIQVRHLDGDPANNKLENIAVGTQSENMLDRPREVRIAHGRLSGRARSRLSDQDVIDIRQKFSKGAPLSQIMREYGIAKSTASYIKNRKTYRYLG